MKCAAADVDRGNARGCGNAEVAGGTMLEEINDGPKEDGLSGSCSSERNVFNVACEARIEGARR